MNDELETLIAKCETAKRQHEVIERNLHQLDAFVAEVKAELAEHNETLQGLIETCRRLIARFEPDEAESWRESLGLDDWQD